MKDELPCNNLPRPDECGVAKGQVDLFDLEDREEEDDDWGDWRRRKRDTVSGKENKKEGDTVTGNLDLLCMHLSCTQPASTGNDSSAY